MYSFAITYPNLGSTRIAWMSEALSFAFPFFSPGDLVSGRRWKWCAFPRGTLSGFVLDLCRSPFGTLSGLVYDPCAFPFAKRSGCNRDQCASPCDDRPFFVLSVALSAFVPRKK